MFSHCLRTFNTSFVVIKDYVIYANLVNVCSIYSVVNDRAAMFDNLPVSLPRGSHPFPSRTRKLSLVGPMVLHAQVCGRLGDRRHYFKAKPTARWALLFKFSGWW